MCVCVSGVSVDCVSECVLGGVCVCVCVCSSVSVRSVCVGSVCVLLCVTNCAHNSHNSRGSPWLSMVTLNYCGVK